jgi:hypothetical protein
MFFKRHTAAVLTYADQLGRLASAGYRVSPAPEAGLTLVAKEHYAAELKDVHGAVAIQRAGLEVAGEVAELTDLGFQKIFLAPSGKRMPAVAAHLHGLHAFVEALHAALGLTSLYNEGLGSTNERHLYDRITKRDAGTQPKPWQRS